MLALLSLSQASADFPGFDITCKIWEEGADVMLNWKSSRVLLIWQEKSGGYEWEQGALGPECGQHSPGNAGMELRVKARECRMCVYKDHCLLSRRKSGGQLGSLQERKMENTSSPSVNIRSTAMADSA